MPPEWLSRRAKATTTWPRRPRTATPKEKSIKKIKAAAPFWGPKKSKFGVAKSRVPKIRDPLFRDAKFALFWPQNRGRKKHEKCGFKMEKWTSDISNVCVSMRERADIEGSNRTAGRDYRRARFRCFFVDLGPNGPRPAAAPERKRAKHTQEAWFCVPPSHAASRSNQGNLEAANDATSRRILGARGRAGPGDGDLVF